MYSSLFCYREYRFPSVGALLSQIQWLDSGLLPERWVYRGHPIADRSLLTPPTGHGLVFTTSAYPAVNAAFNGADTYDPNPCIWAVSLTQIDLANIDNLAIPYDPSAFEVLEEYYSSCVTQSDVGTRTLAHTRVWSDALGDTVRLFPTDHTLSIPEALAAYDMTGTWLLKLGLRATTSRQWSGIISSRRHLDSGGAPGRQTGA